MRLFWRQGYAATSTDDLVEAMGIGRQSLYDTFGDKQGLYLEALRLYHMGKSGDVLAPGAAPLTARETIRRALLRPVDRPAGERAMGCMGINATVSFCGAEPQVAALAGNTARAVEEAFAGMVARGVEAGEFSASIDAEAAGKFLYTTLQGLTVRAQADAEPAALRQTVDFALTTLDR